MENINLFTLDAAIILIVLLSVIFGWLRGITKEILSIIAWVGGIYLSIWLFPYTKDFARSYISHGLIADFATACGLFVLFLTIISIFNYVCSNFVKKSMLNTTDKALGGIFGIVRGVIIVAILDLVVMQYMLTQPPKWVEDSKLRPVIESVSDFIILILPTSLQNKVLSNISEMKKQSLLDFIQDGIDNSTGSGNFAADVFKSRNNRVFAENANKPEEDDEYIDEVDSMPSNTTQTAEELATLKPKKIELNKKATEINKRERNDMDRLLDQYNDIDEN